MKRKLVLMTSMLFLLGMFNACSNSEEINSNLSKDGLNVSEESDKIQISFSLLNDKQVPTTTFEYGEDLCFELTITNNSNNELLLFNDILLDKDLFRVFQNDGTDVGTPWTSLGTEYVAIGIGPKVSTRFTCKWIDLSADKPIEKNKSLAPLAKGSYYTSFVIRYRNFDNKLQEEYLEKEFNTTFIIQ